MTPSAPHTAAPALQPHATHWTPSGQPLVSSAGSHTPSSHEGAAGFIAGQNRHSPSYATAAPLQDAQPGLGHVLPSTPQTGAHVAGQAQSLPDSQEPYGWVESRTQIVSDGQSAFDRQPAPAEPPSATP